MARWFAVSSCRHGTATATVELRRSPTAAEGRGLTLAVVQAGCPNCGDQLADATGRRYAQSGTSASSRTRLTVVVEQYRISCGAAMAYVKAVHARSARSGISEPPSDVLAPKIRPASIGTETGPRTITSRFLALLLSTAPPAAVCRTLPAFADRLRQAGTAELYRRAVPRAGGQGRELVLGQLPVLHAGDAS